MTYQYLDTAPTTAQPLARHFPKAEAPRPTMTPAEMAKIENRAAGLSAVPNNHPTSRGPVDPNSLGARVFRIVRDKGPIKVADIVAETGQTPRQIYNAVRAAKAYADSLGYDWDTSYVGKYGKTGRQYSVVRA